MKVYSIADYMYFIEEILFMQIGPFPGSHNENARVKVKVLLNLHGIISVESAVVSKKLFLLLSSYNFVSSKDIIFLPIFVEC